jgi:DNA-binding LacI/PurR family transcriptional regulator
LQDIARRAGVSKMTVSLALRGHPDSAAETRDRLRKLAEEMGYRPNPLIVANMAQLRAGRPSSFAGTIAFAGRGTSPERNPLNTQSRRVFMGARRRAEALGYKLEWFSMVAPPLDGRRLTEILRARGIYGVVIFADGVLPVEGYLDWSQFALSAIGRTEVGCELHRTSGDYYRAVREICQRCRERGYRRIGLAVTREHDIAHQSLHRSALLGCQAEWPRADHVPPLVTEQWAAEPFLAWVKRHRPDVVIAGADQPWEWLAAAGYRIPKDIGLIRPHVSDHLLGASGFIFDEAELGAAAVDLVVEQLNHNERGIPPLVKRVLLPGRWYEGKSLRPAPERNSA